MLNIKNELNNKQIKVLNETLHNLSWIDKSHKELYNRLEDDNTITEDTTILMSPFDNNSNDYNSFISYFEAKFNVLNNNNFDVAIKEITAKAEELKEKMPITDLRKTESQLLELKQKREKELKKLQEDNIKNDESKKRFNPNNRLIMVSLCFDDSDSMTDYYNPCRPIKEWVLYEIPQGKRDLKLLHNAVNKYPSLKGLKWSEHRDSYSMNHFGYSITSEAVPINEDIKAYSGHKVNCGFYKVDFGMIGYDGHKEMYPEAQDMPQKQEIINLSKEDITITKNEAKNGIELRFKEKPPEETLTLLKSKGFRWSGFNKVWYNRYDENLFNEMQNQFKGDC